MLTFGQKLRLQRKKRGLSLEDLYHASGIPMSTLIGLEKDRELPSEKTLQMLANTPQIATDYPTLKEWKTVVELSEDYIKTTLNHLSSLNVAEQIQQLRQSVPNPIERYQTIQQLLQEPDDTEES